MFSCFFEDVGRGAVLRKTSFCIVFYNVFGTSTFSKRVKNEKNMYSVVYVFLEGRRHQFSANLGSIWAPFWEASGPKVGKTRFRRGVKKQL